MLFDVFLKKTAPVSGVESLLDYNIHLESSLENNIFSPYVTVKVPVKSLCPCSKGISDYGAHNQRSIITIKTNWSDDLNIVDLINVAETSSSCEISCVFVDRFQPIKNITTTKRTLFSTISANNTHIFR